MYEQLWRACAGPFVHLPLTGERVYYFPQGHLQQVAALKNENSNEMVPVFNLPSKILCRVVNIGPRADTETDEVYAQITLLPEHCQVGTDKLDPLLPEPLRPVVKSFCKKLTTTDISSKLHVRQHDATDCFPPLDMTREKPSQELVAKDLHGFSWHFKHAFTGNPKRHVLTTGWKHFAKEKRLVAGDCIIFIRGENGELCIGIRRVSSQRKYTPDRYLASHGENRVFPTDLLATASYAVATCTFFTVFYWPSCGISQFIVGKNKYNDSVKKMCSVGLRFSMRFEEEGYKQIRCNGSITEVGSDSTWWKDSIWRCLKVKWDDHGATMKPQRVSPWEIDPPELNMELISYQRRNEAKKDILQPSQLAVDPLISSQQCWIQDAGPPNWTSLLQICQHHWVPNDELLQSDIISTGPLFSNEDNWLQEMLNHMELPDQCSLQIPGYDEAVQYEELGQIVGSAGNGSMNMIECNLFPTVNPAIHFSELRGGRVSSEESVQGVDTRKRKLASVGDDRLVKCRIEASEFCGVDSNSDQTYYSSASEGECSRDLAPVQGSENGNDRGLIGRLWDRFCGPLLHQLRSYVAK